MAPGEARRCPRAERDRSPVAEPARRASSPAAGRARCRRCDWRSGRSSGCPSRGASAALEPRRAAGVPGADGGLALPALPRPASVPEGPRRARLRQRRPGAGGGRLRDRAARSPTGRRRWPRRGRWATSSRRGAARTATSSIVGSGAGGAAAAASSPRPASTCSCSRRGRTWTAPATPRSRSRRSRALYRDGGLTIAEGRPAIPTPVGRAVGRHDRDQLGHLLPRPGRGARASWREPSTASTGRPSSPPTTPRPRRSLRVHPVDPERMGRNGQLLRGGRRGARRQRAARSAATPASCDQCSSCPSGCRLDAKRAMHVSYLPRAVAAGARVRAGVEVRGSSSRAAAPTGLELPGRRRQRREARPATASAPGKAVVLAGGAFGTPELLLRSGLRSPSGQLGRNLRIHPACWVGARFEEEVRGWDGVMQSYAVDRVGAAGHPARGDLHAARLRRAVAARAPGAATRNGCSTYDHIASTGVHLSDRSAGRVGLAGDGSLRVTYRLTDEDARQARVRDRPRGGAPLRGRGRRGLSADRRVPTIPPGESPTSRPRLQPAATLRLEAFHPMGTRAHGRQTRTASVCDRDGAVHGAEALRRRRQPAAELHRRQPDDDHHRVRHARGRRRPWR